MYWDCYQIKKSQQIWVLILASCILYRPHPDIEPTNWYFQQTKIVKTITGRCIQMICGEHLQFSWLDLRAVGFGPTVVGYITSLRGLSIQHLSAWIWVHEAILVGHPPFCKLHAQLSRWISWLNLFSFLKFLFSSIIGSKTLFSSHLLFKTLLGWLNRAIFLRFAQELRISSDPLDSWLIYQVGHMICTEPEVRLRRSTEKKARREQLDKLEQRQRAGGSGSAGVWGFGEPPMDKKGIAEKCAKMV